MAVPRTHDGSVGPRSTSATLTIVSAVLAVVVVACLVVLGVRFADTSGSFGDRVSQVFGGDDTVQADDTADDPRTRELVMSQANQFIIRINTYGPSDLDKQDKMPGYVERVKEVITPKLAVDFEKQVTYAEQSVAQAGLARTVQLYATGTASLDSDLATVLVTGEISQSYPDPQKDEGRIEFEPLRFRYEVRLVRTEGEWLVDDFTPVRGDVEGEPTPGAPTGDPSAPATGAPTGTPGTGDAVTSRYAEIVGRRTAALEQVVGALDQCSFPEPADAGDTTCTGAPPAAGNAARVLVSSLRGAANPTSKVFVGAPPAAIADLVDSTETAAGAVVTAAGALRPACVVTDSADCADQRTAVSDAVRDLQTVLQGWEGVG